MRFTVLLAVVALVPIAAGVGYVVGQPDEPTVLESLQSTLLLDQESNDMFVFAVTAGDMKGTAVPAEQAVSYSDAQLRELGAEKWLWVKAHCWNFSTSGDPEAQDDPQTVSYCERRVVTRKQALAGVSAQTGPPGAPAMP